MKLLTYFLSLISLAASAVAIDLSPEEQAQLNALPPALRAQALERLEQLESSQNAAAKPLEQPEVVRRTRLEDDPYTEKLIISDDGTELEVEGEFTTKETQDELKQFGYDVFAGAPTTFAPATEIPIPSDYIIGPGDQIRIQFFGKQSASYDLYVSREGILQVPDLGPIAVAGQQFSELKAEISRLVEEQMIGVKAFVSLGELRSIRVFILGDVNQPGSYTVSSLSTMINALIVSGGVSPIGSLRNIQLKRSGQTVAQLDLYDFLLNGDTTNDASLQPGDVIFVPTVGDLVGVSGEVKRPAIYELNRESSISEVIKMAGGFTASAFPSITQIERIADTGIREILDIDLSGSQNNDFILNDGDVARIYSTLDRADNVVALSGEVERIGNFQWRDGMRVRDVIRSYADLIPSADLEYALLVSRNPINGIISTRSFSLKEALSSTSSPQNLKLQAKDEILVFNNQDSERDGLEPVVERLQSQATAGEPQKIVTISGNVRHPGSYPLDTDMKINDLIRAGGGFSQDAYTLEAELLRYVDNGKQQRETVLIPINLTSVASGSNDLKLLSFDQLLIKRIPDWNEQETVTLKGEVRFPGTYTIERGESLKQLIARAGGLTPLAHPRSAIFLRESIKKLESEQIAKLQERLNDDVNAAKLREGNLSDDTVTTAEQLLDELESTQAVGRLVIDLASILEGESEFNLTVKGGDELMIPQKPESVTIIGSVNYPTSHIHQNGLSRDDYINLSGGLLKRADKKQIYIVRSNGQVNVDTRSRFFPKSSLNIMPGDTIVVPVDVDRMKPLKYWGEVSQIIYQLALGAAAVNSF